MSFCLFCASVFIGAISKPPRGYDLLQVELPGMADVGLALCGPPPPPPVHGGSGALAAPLGAAAASVAVGTNGGTIVFLDAVTGKAGREQRKSGMQSMDGGRRLVRAAALLWLDGRLPAPDAPPLI